MANLAAERAGGGEWERCASGAARYSQKILGFAISSALLLGLIIWGKNLTADGGIQIPVIRAPAEHWRRQADEPGGKIAQNIGYMVNQLLVGKEAAPIAAEITLADPPVEFHSEDLSRREFVVRSRSSGFNWNLLSPAPGQKTTVSNLNQETAFRAPAAGAGAEIEPFQIEAGTVLAQIGVFASRRDAENKQRALLLSLGKLLRGRDWLVQHAQSGGGNLFRLRVVGFADWNEATVFCGRLAARGAECSPVVAS